MVVMKIKKQKTQKSADKSLENNRIMLKSKQKFRSKNNNAFTEEVNKIALSVSNDKKLST